MRSQTIAPAVAGHSRPALSRALWFLGGWLCFGVGAIGVVLPGIPTTGPMLLALACFARSSQRFHDWLLGHRLFGPSLQRWKKHRIIPVPAKIAAIGSMTASLTYIAVGTALSGVTVSIIAAAMAGSALFIMRFPSRVPQPGPQI